MFFCVFEVWRQMTSGPAGCSKSFKLFFSPAGINHAIYPEVKLRCSTSHEFILAWDKSGIPGLTRDNFIPAIERD